VQPLEVIPTLFALGDNKERTGVEVDGRGGADANFGMDVSGSGLHICGGHRSRSGGGSMSRAEHAGLPQGRAICATVGVGVEGVDRIVLVGNKEDVVSRAVNRQIADPEGLRINLSVYGMAE